MDCLTIYEMGTMKSLTLLWKVMLRDLGIRCCTSTDRDIKTFADRYEHEGLSFLTITLPRFGKDFQKSLDLGKVDSSLFAGFRRSGGLPYFYKVSFVVYSTLVVWCCQTRTSTQFSQ